MLLLGPLLPAILRQRLAYYHGQLLTGVETLLDVRAQRTSCLHVGISCAAGNIATAVRSTPPVPQIVPAQPVVEDLPAGIAVDPDELTIERKLSVEPRRKRVGTGIEEGTNRRAVMVARRWLVFDKLLGPAHGTCHRQAIPRALVPPETHALLMHPVSTLQCFDTILLQMTQADAALLLLLLLSLPISLLLLLLSELLLPGMMDWRGRLRRLGTRQLSPDFVQDRLILDGPRTRNQIEGGATLYLQLLGLGCG